MSAAGTPSRIVTVFGEQLDLYKPREADRFLAHMVTYGAAAASVSSRPAPSWRLN
jgi:hypothetical protein